MTDYLLVTKQKLNSEIIKICVKYNLFNKNKVSV